MRWWPSSTAAARWSDAQIVEEHSFALELADAEVPVVAPCILHDAAPDVRLLPEPGPATLALRPGPEGLHRYSVSPRQAGRSPELEDDAVLVRLGGFIGRLHAVGARRALRAPAHAGRAARRARGRGPAARRRLRQRQPARPWAEACAAAIDCIDAAFAAHTPKSIRLHGDCHPGNLLWRDAGAHVVDLDDACMGPAVQDLWMLLSGEPEAMAWQLRPAAARLRAVHGLRPRRARADRAAAAAAHDPPQRLGGAALAGPGLPRRLPGLRQLGLLGPAGACSCASSCAWPPRRPAWPTLL